MAQENLRRPVLPVLAAWTASSHDFVRFPDMGAWVSCPPTSECFLLSYFLQWCTCRSQQELGSAGAPSRSPQPGFTLQPAIGRPRSWLQFPGRPRGGPKVGLLIERLYQQGGSYASLRLPSFSSPKGLSGVWGIIGMRLRLQICRISQHYLPILYGTRYTHIGYTHTNTHTYTHTHTHIHHNSPPDGNICAVVEADNDRKLCLSDILYCHIPDEVLVKVI